jgi:hypothetical protein
MRHAFAVIWLSFVFAGCGSSTDTSTYQAACMSALNAKCDRASACNLLQGASASSCVNAGQGACSGMCTDYNSSDGAMCVADWEAVSCGNLEIYLQNNIVPSPCDSMCP